MAVQETQAKAVSLDLPNPRSSTHYNLAAVSKLGWPYLGKNRMQKRK